MRQALHIFKKDVRHLRLEIAIAISMVAIFAFVETRNALMLAGAGTNGTVPSNLVMLLLLLAWWTLIGRVIHDEPLPGNRQFWITRPYSWRSLLGAKALFILAFINLPMLAADMVILHACGFSVGAELSGLIWSQVLLAVFFLLPVIALSALTTGFTQLLLAILAPCVIALGVALVSPRLALAGLMGGFAVGYEWIPDCFAFLVIFGAGSAILFWQYTRRGTNRARAFAAAAVILVVVGITLIPFSLVFRIQSWFSKQEVDVSSAHVVSALDDKGLPARVVLFGDGGVGVVIPFQIMGLPPGTSAKIERLSTEFQAPDGSTRKAYGFSLRSDIGVDHADILQTSPDPAFAKKFRDGPLNVYGSVYLTIFGHPQSTAVPLGARAVPVSRVGLCSAGKSADRPIYFLICDSAFLYPAALVSYHFNQPSKETLDLGSLLMQGRPISYSPLPADIGINPVNQEITMTTSAVPLVQATVDTVEPLAHIRLDFGISGLRLGKIHTPAPPISH
jgi:hypothetical protein